MEWITNDVYVKILFLTLFAFSATILWTPLLTHFLYKYKLGKQIRSAEDAPIYHQFHAKKAGTPTMGGMLMWLTTLVTAVLFFYLQRWFPDSMISQFNFLTRSQTLLPLGALVAAALVGLFDDFLNVRRIGPKGGGMGIKFQLLLNIVIASVGAWWFYAKLDWDVLRIPFVGNAEVGAWIIPIFIFIIVATSFSVDEIDGLDGLAGGVLMAMFTAFGLIAFVQGRVDLAAFCAVVVGTLLAFLWFNIPPARFFMGNTGGMGLGTTLGIVAMLTNSALLLPVIGFPLVVVSGSVLLQLASKKFRGKKIFLSTPLHHHLEAIGWPESKIVMRFWIIAAMCAVVGVIFALLDRGV